MTLIVVVINIVITQSYRDVNQVEGAAAEPEDVELRTVDAQGGHRLEVDVLHVVEVQLGQPGPQVAQEAAQLVKVEISAPELQPGQPVEAGEDLETAGVLVLEHEQHLLDVRTHLRSHRHLLTAVEEINLAGPEVSYLQSGTGFLLL